MSTMNIQDLHQFLIDSNKAGYAGGEEKKWIKEADNSTTIPYQKGVFRSHDNFFGGEPYGGRLVVFQEEKPVWIMVYYGWVAEEANPDAVYAILREALMNMPADAPFRGPKEHHKENLTYVNVWNGDVARYSGEEKITDEQGQVLYQAFYRGGLVDQRAGV
jgi:hypothetical protein